MTIPADTCISFTAGHVFAVASAEAIEAGGAAEQECIERSRKFTALVTVPVGLYFLLRWPDWSWMYLTGEGSRNRLTGLLGVCAYLVANELGFRDAARLIKKGRREDALMATVASGGLLGLLSVLGARRLLLIGTKEEFKNGEATLALKHRGFLKSIVASGAFAGVPAAVVIAKNYLQGRR